ncbi:winged helix-turn-helix domain-containing protein, partial [Streptomyces sp. SID7499]|nr:winged helix-turn-helix domain-containing protein [Streptomyces sp. SID7499]
MTPVPPPAVELSADQARRIALRAQGFLGAPDRRAGVPGVLRHLGAVQ